MLTKRIALGILIASSFFFAIRGYIDQTRALRSVDFKPVYAGSRCLLERCNPYDSQVLADVFRRANGDHPSFHPGIANYPPQTLFAVLPFAMLPWGPAHLLWLLTIIVSLTTAAFLVADMAKPLSLAVALCLGALLATSTWLVMNGQPAGPAIGLCVAATWYILRRRFVPLGVFLFALSLTIKPQLGAIPMLYFAASPLYRRRFLQIAALGILVSLPGIVWVSLVPASRNWLHDMTHAISYIATYSDVAAHLKRSAALDATHFVHLQPFLSVFLPSSFLPEVIAWVSFGCLLAICLVTAAHKPPSLEKDYRGLAALACLSLLPVYHRQYDTRLLFLTFPAIAVYFRTRRPLAIAALVPLFLLTVLTWPGYLHFMTPRFYDAWNERHPVYLALGFHGVSLLIFFLSLLFTLAFAAPDGGPATHSAVSPCIAHRNESSVAGLRTSEALRATANIPRNDSPVFTRSERDFLHTFS